jgi:hypothetical protein
VQPLRGTLITHLADGSVGPIQADELRAAEPTPVATFTGLVRNVARVASLRHGDFIFYRGQTHDWRSKSGKTTIYPTLFRPPAGATALRTAEVVARKQTLDDAIAKIRARYRELGHTNELWRYREFATALLQHYELVATPMVDLTTSLHVAASFARGAGGDGAGVVYVIAMPYPTETLSLYPRYGMALARLQSLCPPDARRPQFQEGWLVGRMPLTAEKTPDDDLGGRVVAKYALPAGPAFWDGQFHPIPQDALLPEHDPFGDRLRAILAG